MMGPSINLCHDVRGEARLSLRGAAGSDTATVLRPYLRALLDAGARFVVLDLGGADQWDPALLRLLGHIQSELNDRAGLITLTAPLGSTTLGERPPAQADGPSPVLVAV